MTQQTMPIAVSDRLLFRPWTFDDLGPFRPIATDPEVMRYIGAGEPLGDDRIAFSIGKQVAYQETLGFSLWVLELRTGGGLIGFCGLQPLPGTDDIEVGWWLAREHWGRGLGTEAGGTAMALAFDRHGLDRITAIAQAPNRASIRIMEKLGMRFERIYRDGPPQVVLYAKSRPTPRPGGAEKG